MSGPRFFTGILGWSNKRTGIEFYHSWEDGRWGRRNSLYRDVETERGGWGRLLADDIERETKGRSEGSSVLVAVGSEAEIATLLAAMKAYREDTDGSH